ncbi:GtrA family protein [bacterium]|nr:GtrA family protein [bacterium]
MAEEGAPRRSGLAHWLGFLISGGAAFATDAAVLEALIRLTHWSPLVCRLIAIPSAMLVGWQMHRRFTFAVRTPATLREFLTFATVGWSASAVNYGIFAGLLLLFPGLAPVVALTLSSAVAMVWSYLGYRFHVFR